MITIHGLNKQQIKMCEQIWQFEQWSDLQRWIQGMPNQSQACMAKVLVELMQQEAAEQRIQSMNDYPDADQLFDKIKKIG